MSFPATSVSTTDGSFPVRWSKLVLPGGGEIYALREDLLDGGTKSRALRPFLAELAEKGVREFGYASPFAGFAQLALSYACRDLGLTCRLFAERDPNRGRAHAITEEALRAGAILSLRPSLADAEVACREWADRSAERMKIPLGLDCEAYRVQLRRCIRGVWGNLAPLRPSRVWVSVGSGTLSTALRSVLPPSVEICGINVHVLAEEDPRLAAFRELPNSRYFAAPLPFAQPSPLSPPIPSNVHYDAKVWPFLSRGAKAGDLWWNVAR